MILRVIGILLMVISLLVLIGLLFAPTDTIQNLLLEYFGIENQGRLFELIVGVGVPLFFIFIGGILYRLG